MAKLSAIVITKNEQSMIADCLISLEFADEIIVVDTGNSDNTNKIAIEHDAKVIKSSGNDYSQFRNAGLATASGEWILYIDADERVTPLLRQEIMDVIKRNNSFSAFDILHQNIFLGKQMNFGGWGGDYVTRLLKKSQHSGHKNALHEQPIFEGKSKRLENSLIHFSHRDLSSMLDKTLLYTGFEAQLRIDANHPKIVSWRFVRVMFSEAWKRFIVLEAWRDGVEGVIDGIFQVFNSFIIYARLWEMQLPNEKSSHL